ncbi:MAG: hypothetical protein HPY75_14350 [Actinobacteria bacterium]|nr:hypothetical protein [Actinomycetota bacterium]
MGKEPVFETGLLLAGDVDPASVRRQLSRLVASGRLLQLRRGLYALAPPYQKSRPHPFLVANRITRPSYVSLQSALAHHGLIPEHVPVVTSITTSRPGRWSTSLGDFEYRHIKTALFFGYRLEEVGEGQQALIAAPEKALLDLIYLHAGSDQPEYLRELRLQNMETLDLGVLEELAGTSGSAKLHRAVRLIRQMVLEEAVEYETI